MQVLRGDAALCSHAPPREAACESCMWIADWRLFEHAVRYVGLFACRLARFIVTSKLCV